MKIKAKKSFPGDSGEGQWAKGEVREVRSHRAGELISTGYAESFTEKVTKSLTKKDEEVEMPGTEEA